MPAPPLQKPPGFQHDPRRLLSHGRLRAVNAGDAAYQIAGGLMPLLTLFTEYLIRARIWWYELALTQIDPGHADVPEIILHLCNLSDQLDNLKP